jgi:integrase
LEHDVLPRWGERPIRSITKQDVNDLLDAKASRRERPRKGTKGGAALQSNRTLTRMRTLFAWAAVEDLIDADPSAGVLPRGEERDRDRVLSDTEILWFWRATDQVGWPFGPIGKLLLLTAQRLSEVASLRWAEVNLEKRTWTIPRERTKSDRAHVVALSGPAVEILEGLPRFGDLVFPTRVGTPISSFSKPKARLDASMTAQLREAAGKPDAVLPEWTLHDLRRTAATVMVERLKTAPHVVDRVLNHQSGAIRGVARIYIRGEYADERKAALEALGHWIESLVRPGGAGNVVPLATARERA